MYYIRRGYDCCGAGIVLCFTLTTQPVSANNNTSRQQAAIFFIK